SALPFDENVRVSAAVVDYAHVRGVTVEAELGALAGVEEEGTEHGDARYTDPEQVGDFVTRTGVDSLAVSIGTSHGVVKIRSLNGTLPSLRFDILDAINQRMPGFPIVLHGAS